jgi:predicted nuclease of restriction endonuclease-like (RecB) superfamily
MNPTEYTEILQQAVAEIRVARNLVAKQLTSAANSVYWSLGKLLFEKQLEEGYGSGVVKQLSVDLKSEFPDMGLSSRNLWHMKRFYERYYQSDTKLQRSVAVLPWRHNLLILEKTKDDLEALFYAQEVLSKGWSRDLLLNAIKMDTYGQVQSQIATNNFSQTLPAPNADYANEVFKSTYNLGFLGITEPENGLSYGLSANIKRVNKYNFVFGFDLGYEILRSKIQVNSVVDYSGMVNYTFDARGQTFLNANFINLNPQIGYRLSVKQVSIDLLTGYDVAFCLNATEKGKTTTTNGTEFSSSIDRKTINSDIRLRFQVSTGFKKMGAYIGYSLGLANYKSGYVGGVNECYARLFRFGLTCQIK